MRGNKLRNGVGVSRRLGSIERGLAMSKMPEFIPWNFGGGLLVFFAGIRHKISMKEKIGKSQEFYEDFMRGRTGRLGRILP